MISDSPDASGLGPTEQGKRPLGTGVSVVWIVAGILALVVIGLYSWLRVAYGWNFVELADHGALGDALAPIGAILGSFAVVAAVSSLGLQRRELALQRHELAMQRGEMNAQRSEMAKTAQAQERLAAVTMELARAQEEGNKHQVLLVEQIKVASLVSVATAIYQERGDPNAKYAWSNLVRIHSNLATQLFGGKP